MKYILVEKNKIIGASECLTINEEIKNIEVSEEIYNDYIKNKTKYMYQAGKIIQNPQYEILKQKEYIKKQIEEIVEKLSILDSKRIRAVCEDEVKDEKTGETWLDFYNSQIYDLRIELNSLESQL